MAGSAFAISAPASAGVGISIGIGIPGGWDGYYYADKPCWWYARYDFPAPRRCYQFYYGQWGAMCTPMAISSSAIVATGGAGMTATTIATGMTMTTAGALATGITAAIGIITITIRMITTMAIGTIMTTATETATITIIEE